MDDDQQFCLRWNNHQSTLVAVFDTLLEKGMHVDCTLAAEGQTLKAHKVVLSACSPYFESVLSQQYDKHPIIILKDVKYAELRAMMDYMYRGEVNISQDQLAALLKAAESLQIKGLSDNKPSRPPSRPAPPPPPPVALAAHAPPAHPPRAVSPPPQVRDGSIDSREGSVSPSRRRKKARRMSSEVPIVEPASVAAPVSLPAATTTAAPQGNGRGESPHCKEESSRDNLDDVTYDEDADDPHALVAHHPPTHNDVVRNFQWHMERSQDEMNSSDNVRDSQGRKSATPRNSSIMTRSKMVTEEVQTTTLAILKPVKTPRAASVASPGSGAAATPPPPPPSAGDDAKENKTAPVAARQQTAARADPPAAGAVGKGTPRYNIYPRDRHGLPCAQYKTDKGYKCPNCQRSYNARKNLVRHVTLECGREPQYKCPYCSYSKHRRNELKNHIEKKHPEHRPAARASVVAGGSISDASSP